MTDAERADTVFSILALLYPDKEPLILFGNCFELSAAVILSAQCTDARVNAITPRLFQRYPDPEALAAADIGELEEIIHPAGFFHQKAVFLKKSAGIIRDKYGGEVPEAMEDLLQLPGIGRKAAHVIRGHCFGKPAIIVDTHFSRVTERIGMVEDRSPERVEKKIAQLLPEERWTDFSMMINRHGRAVCTARKPRCVECAVNGLCGYWMNPAL